MNYSKVYNFLGCRNSYKKEQQKTLFETKNEGCDKNEYKTIQASVNVPAIPPTEISHSKVIKVKYLIRVSKFTPEKMINYLFLIISIISQLLIKIFLWICFLQIKAITPLPYKNITLELPITIGSYPFQNNA